MTIILFALEAARGQALCSHSLHSMTLAQPLLHNGRFMLLLRVLAAPQSFRPPPRPPTCSCHGTLTWGRGAKGEVPWPCGSSSHPPESRTLFSDSSWGHCHGAEPPEPESEESWKGGEGSGCLSSAGKLMKADPDLISFSLE